MEAQALAAAMTIAAPTALLVYLIGTVIRHNRRSYRPRIREVRDLRSLDMKPEFEQAAEGWRAIKARAGR